MEAAKWDFNMGRQKERRKRRRNGFAGKVWALHTARIDPVWDPYKALSLRNFRTTFGVGVAALSAHLGLGTTRGH